MSDLVLKFPNTGRAIQTQLSLISGTLFNLAITSARKEDDLDLTAAANLIQKVIARGVDTPLPPIPKHQRIHFCITENCTARTTGAGEHCENCQDPGAA